MKVDRETAANDLERFMTAFKLDPIKRKKLKDTIDKCIELICYGMLIITEDNKLEYPLLEPVVDDEGKVLLSKLVFNQRRTRVEDVEKISNISNEIEQTRRLISLLTGCNPQYVSKMTNDDLLNITDLAAFFLPAQ